MPASTGKEALRHLILLVIAVLGVGNLLWAQIDTGAILGTVQDQTGAVIPGVKVTLTNEGTSLTLATVTADDGSYIFTPIKIGIYTVAAEKQDFQKVSHIHIIVHVQEQVKVDLTLAPGLITQSVEVSAVSPVLQTQTSTVGQTITSRQVTDLPLTGRNYTFLAQITAGVTSNGSRVAGTGGFTANGLQWSHNSYILDGIDNNNDEMDFLNGAAYVILTPPDAIQEFKVQTSNFNAEYGRAGSAVLNVTTKSGTNEFHGDAWEFLRNDALNATSFFDNRRGVKKPTLRQNQFGFTVGGPFYVPHLYNGHDKTFFFGDYQGTRIRQQALRNPTVPTLQERNSGFTNFQELILNQSGSSTDALGRKMPQGTILDPATTRTITAGQIDPVTGLLAANNGVVRDPFYQGSLTGIRDFTTPATEALMNTLPASRLSPNAIKLLNAYPTPNVTPAQFNNFGLFSNHLVLRPQPDNTNQFDVRVDHNFSSKDQMFGRWSYSRRLRNVLNNFTGPIDDSGFGQGDRIETSFNSALSHTHLFSPTMINEARFGYSRLAENAQPAVALAQGIPQQFGIQGAPQGPGLGGLPLINISGISSVGPGEFASPNTRVSDTAQLTENLTKTYHSHTFKGGFEVQFIRFSFDNPRDPRGRIDFRGNYSGIPSVGLGSGMADLLLTPIKSTVPNGIDFEGGPGFVIADSNVAPDNVRRLYGTYFQDDWKVTRKLTLNLGLRWEFFGQIRNRYGAQANFVPGPPGAGAAYVITNAGKNVPLSPAFTAQLVKDGIALQYSDVPGLIPTPIDNFAPRVGFAYQVTPKLVVRSSYGIFYSGFENVGGSPDPGTNYPFAVEPTLNDGTGGRDTFQSQNTVIPPGQFATLENALTFVTPNPTNPAFNPKGSGFQAFATDWHTGSSQEWSLFLQYALTPNDSIQIGYIGNHSVHLINGWRTNSPSIIIPAGQSIQNIVPFPDFGTNRDYVDTNGDGYYHGLQLTYERRFNHGLSILANFTHARCKTDIRNILNDNTVGGLQRAPYLAGFGLKGDYGFCADDAPKVFHGSGTWQLPFGKDMRFGRNTGGAVNHVLGGWIVNGILTVQDGFPNTVTCATGTTGGFGCVALLVPGQPLYLQQGPHGIEHFLNIAAFTQPCQLQASGINPNVPSNPNFPGNCVPLTGVGLLGGKITQFHGPGFFNLDFSLFKQFRTTEKTRLEFRGEFFNILNHPNFGNPGSLNFTQNPTSSNFNFANITGSRGNSRLAQVALKFYW